MKHRSVGIIGAGSLGGFLAKAISELEEVKEISLFDYDHVEKKNLKNSIFKLKDVKKQKIDVIKELIISDDDVDVILYNEKFIEGVTDFKTDVDLIIDCRDFVYDRADLIDIRMYISSNSLIMDGRKNIYYEKNHEGRYLQSLTKNDLRNAARIAALYIHKELIDKIIINQMVQRVDLDYLNTAMNEAIELLSEKPDSVSDRGAEDRLLNLQENIPRILELSAQGGITIVVGDRETPLISRKIPQKIFKTPKDIIECLLSITDLQLTFNNYIVSPVIIGKETFIELLAETGAA